MERRITTLEEFSVIAVQAMQEFDAAILRLEAANRKRGPRLRGWMRRISRRGPRLRGWMRRISRRGQR